MKVETRKQTNKQNGKVARKIKCKNYFEVAFLGYYGIGRTVYFEYQIRQYPRFATGCVVRKTDRFINYVFVAANGTEYNGDVGIGNRTNWIKIGDKITVMYSEKDRDVNRYNP